MSLDIIRGDRSVGFSSGRRQRATLPLPDDFPSTDEIIARLSSRLANLETVVEGKADAGKVRTLIAFSDEAVLIKAQDIVLAGDVTIARIINEQNGTTSGEVPESITRIIGNRVQTGSLVSSNYGALAGSYISLDDGVIMMGGSAAPKFLYEDGDITISGTLAADSIITNSVTVDGVTLGTIKGNASTGASHASAGGNPHGTSIAQISGDLDDIADGSTYFRSTATQNNGGTRAANALNSNYDYIRGLSTQRITITESNPSNGIVVDAGGIRAYASGSPTFTLNASTGSLALKGTLEAGSVITNSVTVDGVTLGTIKGNASTGASHASAGGNPHGTSIAQISGDLDDIADGSTYFRSTATQNNGGTRAANALNSNYDYIRGLSTQRITITESNPSNGIVVDAGGIRAYASGSPTFTLNASTGSAFFGGNVLTNGYLFASGSYLAATGYTAAIQAAPANSAQRAIVGTSSGTGVGATGITNSGVGVQAAATSNSGKALQAVAYSENGIALDIVAGYIVRPKSTVAGVLEVWSVGSNISQGVFYYEFRSA